VNLGSDTSKSEKILLLLLNLFERNGKNDKGKRIYFLSPDRFHLSPIFFFSSFLSDCKYQSFKEKIGTEVPILQSTKHVNDWKDDFELWVSCQGILSSKISLGRGDEGGVPSKSYHLHLPMIN
jgi:hypothetical protein